MTIGTRSVLYGAHCFFIHPFFVAWAWWKLYGFPWDPRLWVVFFVHDLGYLGLPNIDGPEGKDHVFLGAKIAGIFDDRFPANRFFLGGRIAGYFNARFPRLRPRWMPRWGAGSTWYTLSFYHSRTISERYCVEPSLLCYADKLATVLEPRWLYMLRVRATGEVEEYVARFSETHPDVPPAERREAWFRAMRSSFYAAAMQAPGRRGAA